VSGLTRFGNTNVASVVVFCIVFGSKIDVSEYELKIRNIELRNLKIRSIAPESTNSQIIVLEHQFQIRIIYNTCGLTHRPKRHREELPQTESPRKKKTHKPTQLRKGESVPTTMDHKSFNAMSSIDFLCD